MKNNLKFVCTFCSLFLFFLSAITLNAQVLIPKQQQAFRKGCLLVSISEGSTTANYSTSNFNNAELQVKHVSKMDGVRDPLFIEYGLTKHWGVGMSSGNDIFKVDPSKYYGFNVSDSKNNNTITAKTSEFTLDVNYHVYTGRKTDLSIYTSVGSFGVAFKGKDGDYNYNYNAKGGIVRMGVKARYYFYKRLGVLGMVSYYSGTASPKDVKGNTVGNNVVTTIEGYALEFGLCFRFF